MNLNIKLAIYKAKQFFRFLFFLLSNPKSTKYLGEWLKLSFGKKLNNVQSGIPWLNMPTIEFLKKNLNKNMNVFEWGSGGSTVFIANKVNKVISIEYDLNYYHFVKQKIDNLNIKNTKLVSIPPNDEGFLCNKKFTFKNKYFDKYVNYINQFSNNSFDIIIIDGRQRNDCLKQAVNKLKSEGIIVFDNFDREFYQKSLSYLNQWKLKYLKGYLPFSIKINTCLIAIKP